MGDERNILVLAVRPACDQWLTDQALARGMSRADIVEELVAWASRPAEETATKSGRFPSSRKRGMAKRP